MKDFDTSNEFFYHDTISGLTELSIAYLQYKKNSPDTHISLQSIDARDLIQFCDEQSANNPSLKIVSDYLLYDGRTVLGLFEAQKFGDFNLDMLFTKIIVALQFTTRGINYGPALVYHPLEMAQLRHVEHQAVENLWIVNKCSSPGHCKPQDQNLEAMFNNSAKNCLS